MNPDALQIFSEPARRPTYGHREHKTRLKISKYEPSKEYASPTRLPHSHRGIGKKLAGDKISFLRRFLQNRLGQHWDKIYSEIKHVVRQQQGASRWFWQGLEKLLTEDKFNQTKDYFCIAENGTLQLRPRGDRKKPGPKKEEDKFPKFKKIDGIWYEVIYRHHEPDEIYSRSFNSYSQTYTTIYWRDRPSLVERLGNRQLSRKELKKNKLHNDPPKL